MVSSSASRCTITLILLCIYACVCSASFSWSNCGTQLQAGINYVEVSVSPSSIQANGSLSINIQATIVSDISDADTYLTVLKDGETYLSVKIQTLCAIVRASTSSLSCPIPQGDISFTYTFGTIPALITGDYTFKIQSLSQTDGQEIGCLALMGSVSGLVPSSQCTYTSSFRVEIDGDLKISPDYKYIQVGPYGNVPYSGNAPSFGVLTDFTSTIDVGGSISTANFVWGINGTQVSASNLSDNSEYIRTYQGRLFVGYNTGGSIISIFTGSLSWTINHNTASSLAYDLITGTFVFDPLYSAPSIFTYPIVLGNLGPFTISRQNNAVFVVTGSRAWCTCGYDDCGQCGGDGSSCLLPLSTQSQWSVYRQTAVGVGVGGGVFGLMVIVALFFVLRKTKKRNQRRFDDQDLIETPEKPDYGTLAIDEVIQESNNGV